jgi:CubicO group peptidase (beta-lactamase class C family)
MKTLEKNIQAALDESVAEGIERGVQVAVYHRGELVVNSCTGIADATRNRRVDETTLFPVFSTTKGIVATLLHLLVERGQITYETPIAEVWPEFAAHGKGSITLRHALNHTSGIPLMPRGIGYAELNDWDTMCAAIADLTPVSPAGEESAYHAITYGWILGEVARRVDGRSFGDLLRDEISTPLDLTEELFVGLPDDAEPRVAFLEGKMDEKELERIRADDSPQAIPGLLQPLYEWMNRADGRRACLPASNGIMTAHAVARHYASLLPGGVDGIELLPPARIALAIEPQRPRNLKPGDPPPKHRLGYMNLGSFSPTAFGHDGYGGSLGFADPACGLAFGFARNCFVHAGALPRLLQVVREAVLA